MSTAVVNAAAANSATMSTPNSAAAQTVNAADDNNASTNTHENNDGVVLNSDADNNSSFCRLSSIKAEQFEESQQQHCNVPLENSLRIRRSTNDENDDKTLPTNFSELNDDDFMDRTQHNKDASVAEDLDLSSSAQVSPGLSLLQQTAAAASSPPPHSYRHSRAYRHFKNPPQPHMCIRTTTETGEELFINVLSWTRIVIPQEPSDPIPLYGGMRVPPGSPRSPPIVFAVMANPEVLKDSGRHSKDPEERRAMVELMCDFVEAMNPGVKLVRNAIILKDRDISGELKDVWNAVQAQRDREREEQIILQRQQHQQHFHHNINSSPTANSNGTLNGNSFATANNSLATTPPTTHQMFPKSLHNASANSDETTALPNVVDGGTPPRSRKLIVQQVQSDYNNTTSNIDEELEKTKEGIAYNMVKGLNSQVSLTLLAERLDNKLVLTSSREEQQKNELQIKHQQQQQQHNQNILLNDDALSNGSLLELSGSGGGGKNDINNQLNALNCKKEQRSLKNGFATSCNDAEVVINVNDAATTPVSDTPNTPAQIVNPAPATPPVQQTPPTKKEKLGGFLPNGCIFPRFTKNNKYKDKDKEKDSKPKDKEKNALLSALKKSKDKKSSASSAAVNNDENNTSSNTNTNTAVVNNCFNQTQQTSFNKQQKNCLPQLECGVQKLDLKNHHHHHHHHNHPPHNSENSTTTTTTTSNTTKNNAANKTNSSSKNSGVGVH